MGESLVFRRSLRTGPRGVSRRGLTPRRPESPPSSIRSSPQADGDAGDRGLGVPEVSERPEDPGGSAASVEKSTRTMSPFRPFTCWRAFCCRSSGMGMDQIWSMIFACTQRATRFRTFFRTLIPSEIWASTIRSCTKRLTDFSTRITSGRHTSSRLNSCESHSSCSPMKDSPRCVMHWRRSNSMSPGSRRIRGFGMSVRILRLATFFRNTTPFQYMDSDRSPPGMVLTFT
mmetsp:Transcript_143666/g.250746  ORF Transcript_143666/g.250746 Transcript_143666/m.250746 type:complete len:230 (+) Transcript_143666:72-761(+)